MNLVEKKERLRRALCSAIAVRNLDYAGTLRQLLDKRVGGGTVRRVEIGVPFVEQIDGCLGVSHDLLQRFELPLPGRKRRPYVDSRLLVVHVDVFVGGGKRHRRARAREMEGEAVRR